MTTLLYRLGQFAVRFRRQVIGAWLIALVLLGSVAAVFGGKLTDEFSFPGTESQAGLNVLDERFPELAAVSGQIVFVAEDGQPLSAHEDAVDEVVADVGDLGWVESVTDPLEGGEVSEDGTAGLSSLTTDLELGGVTEEQRQTLLDIADEAAGHGLVVEAGGALFTATNVQIGATDVLGIFASLLVLLVTLRAVRPALMPLVSSLIAVGVTMALVLWAASSMEVSTSTPVLALMLGLAVGIDYALFLISRQWTELATGVPAREAVPRAVAGAGPAILFAGITNVIALFGMAIIDMPFLTILGAAAGVAVIVAVAADLTIVPALLAGYGERFRPRPGSRSERLALAGAGRQDPDRPILSARWVRLVTRRPWATIVAVVLICGALAIPAKDLTLGLPDNGSQSQGSPARVTYDLVEEHFGPGHNTPLLVTADIVNTSDPVGVMEDLGDDLAELDGVAEIGLATPNPTADLGVVQIIPEQTQTDPRTVQLVEDIRAAAPALADRYGISNITVTGQSAVSIDIAEALNDALLPFGSLIVGLSVLLALFMFRSVAIPLKAAFGYLLSAGAALGVTTMVFNYGWNGGLIGSGEPGSVLAFAPIFVLGVLFGLAMDYEGYTTTSIQNEYFRTRDAKDAVRSGFVRSARAVTAAALIMVLVFVFFAFSPSSYVPPIAVGLTVGLAIDAFLVRMTLGPAILTLLGDRAWALPGWLDRAMPDIDLEGRALPRHISHESWTAEHGDRHAIVLDADVPLRSGPYPVEDLRLPDVTVEPGTGLLISGREAPRRAALGMLTGHVLPAAGRVAVLDRLLPEEAGAVRRRSELLPAGPETLAALRRLRPPRRGDLVVCLPDLAAVPPDDRPEVEELLARLQGAGALLVLGLSGSAVGAGSAAAADAAGGGDESDPPRIPALARLRLELIDLDRTRALEGAPS